MLDEHIDIDPLAEGWTRNPFERWIAADRLYGHGVYNMKAGGGDHPRSPRVQPAGVRRRGDVVVACVTGELNGGIRTCYAIEHGERSDTAVAAEPHACRTIITKHTGTMDVVVHTLGRAVSAAAAGGTTPTAPTR